jgi:hypothetical protein
VASTADATSVAGMSRICRRAAENGSLAHASRIQGHARQRGEVPLANRILGRKCDAAGTAFSLADPGHGRPVSARGAWSSQALGSRRWGKRRSGQAPGAGFRHASGSGTSGRTSILESVIAAWGVFPAGSRDRYTCKRSTSPRKSPRFLPEGPSVRPGPRQSPGAGLGGGMSPEFRLGPQRSSLVFLAG